MVSQFLSSSSGSNARGELRAFLTWGLGDFSTHLVPIILDCSLLLFKEKRSERNFCYSGQTWSMKKSMSWLEESMLVVFVWLVVAGLLDEDSRPEVLRG